MQRLHMSGLEPQRAADSGPGGAHAAVTHQVDDYSQHSTGSGCRHGWEEAAGSSSPRLVANSKDRRRSLGLLCPVPGTVREHLRAPRRPAPPPAPVSTPLRTRGCAPHLPRSVRVPLPSAAPHLPAGRRPQPWPALRGGRPLLRLFFRLRPGSPELRQLRYTEPP